MVGRYAFKSAMSPRMHLDCAHAADVMSASTMSRALPSNAWHFDSWSLRRASPAGSFSQPGLGGREGEVKALGVWGGNPSVTWNAYLERWLMVTSTSYLHTRD